MHILLLVNQMHKNFRRKRARGVVVQIWPTQTLDPGIEKASVHVMKGDY